jgi:uncharacterized protein YjbI with pentapeptide repeats
MLKNIQSSTFKKAYEDHQQWINEELAPGGEREINTKEEKKEAERIDGLRGSLVNTNLYKKDNTKASLFINRDFRYFDFSGSCFFTASSARCGLPTEFENSIFIGCNFTDCDLSHVASQNCDFSGCDFRKANLNNSIFRKCKLRNCNFQRASMTHVEMSECDLFGADMSICRIKDSRIFNCIATGVSLVNSTLTGCNLRLLRFKRINLENCNIENCDVKYSDLQNIYGDKK